MKLFLENILITSSNEFFQLKEEVFPHNDFPLHYHADYEIIFIIKGTGKRYIGNHIAQYQAGEVYFIGPNLPHTFYNKDFDGDTEIRQIVLQFKEDFLGKGFFSKKAFSKIKSLFELSKSGIQIPAHYAGELGATLTAMLKMEPGTAVISLLFVLDRLAKLQDLKEISSGSLNTDSNESKFDRLGPVHEYILENFKKNIDLEKAASLACLSPTAFCRYFKRHTRKTFSEFVLDLRISHACKLLQHGKLNSTQIALESGFNNPSYFNRKFKEQLKLTPLDYHKQYFPLSNSR
ncbi:MAG: AraC family transcriptional regulator [Bacteroidota bacterium]